MATEQAIKRWDKVLEEVELSRRQMFFPLEELKPGYAQFGQAMPMLIGFITTVLVDAWVGNPPVEDSDLYKVLKPVYEAAMSLDPSKPGIPQIDDYMGTVKQARSDLKEPMEDQSALDIVNDMELALKVAVLVARVSHQGAMGIADKERDQRTKALNRGTERGTKHLDLQTMEWVDATSPLTLNLADFLAMVDPGIATMEQFVKGYDESDQPPVMKQFAAQWAIYFFTEWEEMYRKQLAAAHGCEEGHIKSDYIGDLKNMRQDYAHNRGISRNSARNKVLKWFTKGQDMIPTHANYMQLLSEFPRTELLRVPTPPKNQPQRQPVAAKVLPELSRRFEACADLNEISKDDALAQAIQAWIDLHPTAAT